MPLYNFLKKISFKELKSLRELDFSFEDKRVTAILGPNGAGKSTILHTLLCIYKPYPKSDCTNYKYNQFFIPDDKNGWEGSCFTVEFEYKKNQQEETRLYKKTITKNKRRWLHDYNKGRIARDVFFIGIETCVPDVELEKAQRIKISKHKTVKDEEKILKLASDIMDFDYTEYDLQTGSGKKDYRHCVNSGVSYFSVSMGAGEQRLFKILETLVTAPEYSLIVIDEIDLTLHTGALKRLLKEMVKLANIKKLQIVFTTHREEIAQCEDINVRHIWPDRKGGPTHYSETTTIPALEKLTDAANHPLVVLVEYDVATEIVWKIASELNLSKRLKTKIFGSIENAFTAIAGLELAGELTDNIIAVLDGDKYIGEDERMKQIKSRITGKDPNGTEKRNKAFDHILQFAPPEIDPLNPKEKRSPDYVLYQFLRSRDSENEFVVAAQELKGVSDSHDYINRIANKMSSSREKALQSIIAEAAQADGWAAYTAPVREWLQARKEVLSL